MFFSKLFSKFKNEIEESKTWTKQTNHKPEGEPARTGEFDPKIFRVNTSSITTEDKTPTITPVITHIEDLNAKIKKLKLKGSLKKNKRKHRFLSEEICDILCGADCALTPIEVFVDVRRSKLRNKQTTANTVKSTLYHLEYAGIIERGNKKGTFKAKGIIE